MKTGTSSIYIMEEADDWQEQQEGLEQEEEQELVLDGPRRLRKRQEVNYAELNAGSTAHGSIYGEGE